MEANELRSCVEKSAKSQAEIAADLGLSPSGLSRWMSGERKIDLRGRKMLRLYFYGEEPFTKSEMARR